MQNKDDFTALYHDIRTTSCIIAAKRTTFKYHHSKMCTNACNHLSFILEMHSWCNVYDSNILFSFQTLNVWAFYWRRYFYSLLSTTKPNFGKDCLRFYFDETLHPANASINYNGNVFLYQNVIDKNKRKNGK